MGVVVAHGAIDLAQQRHSLDLFELAPQPVHHVGQFLADRGGRSGLAVGTGQHRLVGMLLGQIGQTCR